VTKVGICLRIPGLRPEWQGVAYAAGKERGMGWFEGFPFVSREERERRRREFEKRVVPFGLEEQRGKLKETLIGLFPDLNYTEAMFAFYDAKDAYTLKEKGEAGLAAARLKLKKLRWIDARKEQLLLRLVELESEIGSLDEFPAAAQVKDSLYAGDEGGTL
jgi:hypothetical protein